jgi:hypothetical protein
MAAHQGCPDSGYPISLTGVVPVADVAIPAAEDAGGVDRTVDRIPRTIEMVGIGYRDDRAQQRLAGHARLVGTFTADQLTLDHRNTEPRRPGALSGSLTDRSGTQHHDIVSMFGCCHFRSLFRYSSAA